MVQGVFLELGSSFLAKMACISPTKSRVKHRTLKKNLTFFRLYQHGLVLVPKHIIPVTTQSALGRTNQFCRFTKSIYDRKLHNTIDSKIDRH